MENLTPTEFAAVVNQTLEYVYSSVTIIGEVSSFKINQKKWVFFDLKDEETSLSCFMTLWSLRQPLEDGMKVIVRGTPKLTKWGKFSLTVTAVQPVGEGSLKKAYEILKQKLEKEGLFDQTRKRQVPEYLNKIGIISSTQAAGYADFIKIINARWGGMEILVAHTQVQGIDAPDQIIRALDYFNEKTDVQVIAILRGGGSSDDLACFNDEKLARKIAASKIPVACGIGHEVDECLCDLVCDIRASTPSNAAEILTPDKESLKYSILRGVDLAEESILREIYNTQNSINDKIKRIQKTTATQITNYRKILSGQTKILLAMNPEMILKQGYAILNGKISPGNVVKITTFDKEITTLVQEIKQRKSIWSQKIEI